MRAECVRESEVLEVVQAGRWPEQCPPELAAHVAACASCTELLTVAAAFAADYAESLRTAPVPTSGVMWWRVQRRVREEALRTATRTVTAVQMASIAAALAIALVILGAYSISGSDFSTWLTQFIATVQLPTLSFSWTMPVVVLLVSWALLAPVAVWVAVARD